MLRSGHFPTMLKTWRHHRRLSQLDLALTAGVSQRHVSFLESGRAQPSRAMILQLTEALEVPLRDRNDWLTAAGFAPVFAARALDDPEMAQVMGAVRMMLEGHAPFPAVALDRAWNVRLANEPFMRLAAWLGVPASAEPPNLLRLFFHPAGLRGIVTNWDEIAPLLWQRAQREAETLGGQPLKELLAELAAAFEPPALTVNALLPVLPVVMEQNGQRVSVFSVISTFGTAQDVTADELRMECFFPADAATEAFFRARD